MLGSAWGGGPATRRQVADVLYPGGASQYATVQKLLERLEQKGYVARAWEDGQWLFHGGRQPRRPDQPPDRGGGRAAVRRVAHAAVDEPGQVARIDPRAARRAARFRPRADPREGQRW
ncbi:MAG: BlaI/MecI/CopY family transcriptional regulator [Gemmataceae bacterium]